MVNANRLVLSGLLSKTPVRKRSPAGIPHCQFVLEHQSVQQEAGLTRQAWCKMPVIASGESLQVITNRLTVGSQLTVQGFVVSHVGRNGLRSLVLHAEQIEIDTGD